MFRTRPRAIGNLHRNDGTLAVRVVIDRGKVVADIFGPPSMWPGAEREKAAAWVAEIAGDRLPRLPDETVHDAAYRALFAGKS